MSVLIVSMDAGFTRLHQEMEPFLKSLGVPFQTVHDQATARAAIEQHPPRLALLDEFVPPAPASNSATAFQVSESSGVQKIEVPGMTGARVTALFTDTLELATWLSAAHPETAIVTLYGARTGMPKTMKLALESLPSFKGYFPYSLTEANKKKLDKVIRKTLGLP